MKVYLMIGTLLALWGYTKKAPNYGLLSALMLVVGWPIFIAVLFYSKARRPK